jgi:hypothetical protein
MIQLGKVCRPTRLSRGKANRNADYIHFYGQPVM